MAKKKPRRVVIFVLFRIVGLFIFFLPMKVGLKLGQLMGRMAFYVLRRERSIAINNLWTAFGDSISPKERLTIARRVFENLGKGFTEIVSLRKFHRGNIDTYIRCEGLERIEELIRKGKGGIVLSAHFGNWELLAHYFAIKGYPVNVIARRMRAEQFERFLSRIRKVHGVNILYRDTSIKEVMTLLKRNKFVGIMPDQDIDSVSGVFVDFFGRPAYTPDGPAILSLLTGVPVIPCFIVRNHSGHRILIEEPLEVSCSGDRERYILENTQRYTKVIEDYIRRFPEQWVWFHERWKTQPGLQSQGRWGSGGK